MKVRDVTLIVLYNHKKQILLQHRSEDAKAWPGYWGCFGGGIEDDENLEEAVRRETKEELGYLLLKPKLILTQESKGRYNTGMRYIFIEEYDPKQRLILGEGQDMKWLSFSEARKLKLSDTSKKVIEYIDDNKTLEQRL